MTLASWIMRLWKRCANGQCSVCRKAKAPSGSTRIRDRAHGYLPVARGISARRLGRTEGKAAFRKAAETGRQEAAVGLQHGDPEEPVTTEVRVCAVDPRDGGQADRGQVRRKIERQFGGASVGATGHHLQKAIAPCDRTRRGSRAAGLKKEYPKIKAMAGKKRRRYISAARLIYVRITTRGAAGANEEKRRSSQQRAPAIA